MAGLSVIKCIAAGNRVDIRVESTSKFANMDGLPFKDYRSQVYDVISEQRILLAMPMEKFGMVLLPEGEEYDLFFNASNNFYQCRGRVVGKEKRDTMFVLIMDIVSKLVRDQRREYYRFNCNLPLETRPMEKNELINFENHGWQPELLEPDHPVLPGTIADISGGGIRFVLKKPLENDGILVCSYRLTTDRGVRDYLLPCQILEIRRNLNRSELFDHRVKYLHITSDERDDIMKFIFREERKRRR